MELFRKPSELEQYKRRLGFDNAGVNINGNFGVSGKKDGRQCYIRHFAAAHFSIKKE